MRIPSSAVMWWRAQMRARQEAAREAARPITVAQVVALVTLVAVSVGAFIALSPWLAGVVGGWMPDLASATGLATLRAPSGSARARLGAVSGRDRPRSLARTRAGRDLFAVADD